MIMCVGFRFKCDRCGYAEPMQHDKKLPIGWKRIRGKDVCDRCLWPKLTDEEFRKKHPQDPEFGRTQEFQGESR